MTDEDLVAACGIRRCCRVIRAINARATHVWIEREARQAARFDRASKKLVIQIKGRRVVRGKEGDTDRMQPRFRVKLQIDRAGLARAGDGRHALIPIEKAQSFPIEQDLELLAANLSE